MSSKTIGKWWRHVLTPFLCIIISLSFCLKRKRINLSAGVAQLVEHHLAKVDVEGSNPFARSIFFYLLAKSPEILSPNSGTQAAILLASFLPKSIILAPAPLTMGIIGNISQGFRSRSNIASAFPTQSR
jgi:hypothetical protein